MLTLNFVGTEKVIISDKERNTLVVTRSKAGYSFESLNRGNDNSVLKSIFDVQRLVKSTLVSPSRTKDGYDARFSKLFKSISASNPSSFRALHGQMEKGKISA